MSDIAEMVNEESEYDAFICHASENKADFVKPLAESLHKKGLQIWLDDWEIVPGSSLSQSIDNGISKSHKGIIVLSNSFFDKEWAKRELRGFTNRNVYEEDNIIIPIWLDVKAEAVRDFSAPLSDLRAVTAEGRKDVESAADQVYKTITDSWAEKEIGPAGKRPHITCEDSHLYPDGDLDFTLSNIGDAPAERIECVVRIRDDKRIIGRRRATRHGKEYNGYSGLGDYLHPGEENVLFKFSQPELEVADKLGENYSNEVIELCYSYDFEDGNREMEPLWEAEIEISPQMESISWSVRKD